VHIIVVLCIAAVLSAGVARAADAKARAERQKQLIRTIKGKAPQADKDKACRELQVIGTAACVDALASLLTDEKLSHMARWALEPMPYPQAAQALRAALGKTSGATKVGVITSLGFRRDKASTGELVKLLKDRDAAIAGAAAAALGRIGTLEAAGALDKFRAGAGKSLQAVAAEASLTAAEQLLAQGKGAQAAKICEDLQADKWPAHVRLGAFVGLLGAGGEPAVARAVAAIKGNDAAMRSAAIASVSKLKGDEVGMRLAAVLGKLPADPKALLIGALGDLGDTAVRPTIVKAAADDNPQVRMAAIRALGKIGDVSCVKVLSKVVVEGKTDAEKQAAVNSMHGLKGDKVNAAIVASVKAAPAAARVRLIEALITRKANEAVGDLAKEAKGPEAAVRLAALKALGWIGEPKDLPVLIALAVKPADETAGAAAERSIVQVSRKITDETARADAVLEALKNVGSLSATCSLLRVLGGIGNAKAFAVVNPALKAKNAEVQDAAVRALADWPDSRALDALLGVIKTTDNNKHSVFAMRGCVRILTLGDCTVERTLAGYGELIKASKGPEDKRLVLAGLGRVADPAALSVVRPFLFDKDVKAEAEFATVGIARAIIGPCPKVSKQVATSLSKSKNGAVRKQAGWILWALRGSPANPVSAGSWKSLFNGKDLTGWNKKGAGIFKVEDGCLLGTQTDGRGGDLFTEAKFDNFELRFTYRMVWPANSGIWFRHDGKKGYQFDILKYKRPVVFSGSLYCPGKMFITKNLKESLENRDGWNEGRISAMGDELTLWLNGSKVGQVKDSTLSKGSIGIQVHGGAFKGMKIIIKRMEIRSLSK